MQFHLDQVIGAAGVIAWTALAYRAGIWTRRQSALREMMETAAHGVTAGALLVLALNGLPEQPCRAAAHGHSEQGYEPADEAGLVRISGDFPVGNEPCPEGVVNPLPDSDKDASDAQEDERLPQGRIATDRSSTHDECGGQKSYSPVPLVGAKTLQLVHPRPSSFSPRAKHSAAAHRA